MKKIVLIAIILFFILGCGEDKGFIRICLIDSPPPQDVQNIYLTIMSVGIRNAEGYATTLVSYPYSYDIARLIGGKYVSLTFSSKYREYVEIDAGDYSRILLLLAQVNSVVVGGDSIGDTLLIPDGSPVIYELEQDFTVLPGQDVTIIVDFDASRSINWESQPYELIPSIKTFPLSVVGSLQGIVKNTSGDTVRFATCMAANDVDTFTTLSDSTSSDSANPYTYRFTIPEGIYNISVSAEGYTTADTIYTGVNVVRDTALTGYDFILE